MASGRNMAGKAQGALHTVPGIERSAAIDRLVVGRGVLRQAAALFRETFGDAPVLLVADGTTFEAAGEAVRSVFRDAGAEPHLHVMPARPRLAPDRARGDAIAALIRQIAADSGGGLPVPLAIGSGVVNDLTRYAAFEAGTPFMSVPTAASMDGYTSAGAPLNDDGFKITIQCAPPRVILADLDVIAAAPAAMTGWGYGDLAGKMPAGGDWLVADALGLEPLDEIAWPLVQDNLRQWLADPEGVGRGEPAAVAGLFSGLAATGVAMELYGSSRPASGADHQIAHIWEMENLTHGGEKVSHGACVAIGCLTVLALFDWLLSQDLTRLDPPTVARNAPDWPTVERAIAAGFEDAVVAERTRQELREKWVEGAALAERLERLKDVWPALRARLSSHLMREGEMRRLLAAAGAPVRVRDIGLTLQQHRQTVLKARWIRRRYTVLDLLDEAGLLYQAVAEGLHETHPLYA
ncbi:sn-glycerol-1-phosphate dehydrogenase [Chelativorans intermedius]|uniref:Sn-glycerol-1-phosphate dehydrogenase n=1 Tax=Chelativorans intermedius TaxID=515947 RepID=A0ABV6D6D6_9HYPH|nr:sn-glycerol-1-phosphate dehydrogenase [Chelativorans intermedius]MCT8999432.1 sn-glycerol-1-phosphate dehydrogenase [Chelativorans intermedius]